MVEKIQILCRHVNITLAQLEKELNFGNGTIRRWDDSSPSVDKVLKVANYFGVSINCFFEDDENTRGTNDEKYGESFKKI